MSAERHVVCVLPNEGEQGRPFVVSQHDHMEQVTGSIGSDTTQVVVRADIDKHTAYIMPDVHDCAIDVWCQRIFAPPVSSGGMLAVGAQVCVVIFKSACCDLKSVCDLKSTW